MLRWLRRRPQTVWGVSPEKVTVTYEGEHLRSLLSKPSPAKSVSITPAFGRDHIALDQVRRDNMSWLSPWEASLPARSKEKLPTWDEYPRLMDEKTTKGEGLTMLVRVNEEIVGVVTLGAIQRGALQTGILGYWIAERWASLGITSLAVAATLDVVLQSLDLHRIEVNVRPSNVPSLALCRKLEMREEGVKPRYMNIDGKWADHVAFAVDTEMVEEEPMVSRLHRRRLKARKRTTN